MSVRRSNAVFAVLAVMLVGAVVLSGCAPALQAASSAASESPARTITVVGQGEVKAKPDVATTTVGVEVLNASIDDAMAEAKSRMAAVLAALKKLGIADKDIQTSNFSISFERNPSTSPTPAETSTSTPESTAQPVGFYRVSNMVQVTIRNMDLIGSVLENSIAAGANNIWGVSFALDNTSGLEAQARESAVKDAKARAESLAQLNGVSLGSVVAVSEVVGNTFNPTLAQAKAYDAGSSTIEPGEVSFTTQIQVVYAIQ